MMEQRVKQKVEQTLMTTHAPSLSVPLARSKFADDEFLNCDDACESEPGHDNLAHNLEGADTGRTQV